MLNWDEKLNKVLNGESDSEDIPKIPISRVITWMEKQDFSYDVDTNGYQVDFWVYFYKGLEEKYTLSGDLWYEETHTFSREVL